MNPKAAQSWNFALDKFKQARQYIDKEQPEVAKTEIAKAVYVGAGAIYYIYGPGEAEKTAHIANQTFIAEIASSQKDESEKQ